MGLESGQFISDLVTNWPLPTDRRREGDDHLRLLKTTLKNTFPNINGAVTATPSQLNSLPTGNLAAILNELREHLVPKGTIAMWSGLSTAVPQGWVICDGRVVSSFGGAVPDLRGRFILAASPTAGIPVNAVGGASTSITSSAGTHEHVVDGVALTVGQLPAHAHRIYAAGGSNTSSGVTGFGAGDAGVPATIEILPRTYTSNNASSRPIVEASGSGNLHTHGMQPTGGHTHVVVVVPLYYALTYIIKVLEYVDPV